LPPLTTLKKVVQPCKSCLRIDSFLWWLLIKL